MRDVKIRPSYGDRILLAREACVRRFEERDGFISDDDVYDVAECYSTSEMEYDAMRDELFEWLDEG